MRTWRPTPSARGRLPQRGRDEPPQRGGGLHRRGPCSRQAPALRQRAARPRLRRRARRATAAAAAARRLRGSRRRGFEIGRRRRHVDRQPKSAETFFCQLSTKNISASSAASGHASAPTPSTSRKSSAWKCGVPRRMRHRLVAPSRWRFDVDAGRAPGRATRPPAAVGSGFRSPAVSLWTIRTRPRFGANCAPCVRVQRRVEIAARRGGRGAARRACRAAAPPSISAGARLGWPRAHVKPATRRAPAQSPLPPSSCSRNPLAASTTTPIKMDVSLDALIKQNKKENEGRRRRRRSARRGGG